VVLAAGTALGERYAVSASKANIRSGPGTKYDWVWQVGKYYPIEVENKKGNWYYFKDFEGDAGWIHKSLIEKIPTVITDKDKCNVRKGPSTKYDIAFTVGQGIPFRVIEKKGNWIHVEHADGDKGWIHKSLVW
jgi:SH3-like domain-containing protein